MNCELCGRALSEKEPIYRATTIVNWPLRPGVTIHAVCTKCTRQHFAHAGWLRAEPCEHCGRPVVIQIGRRKRPRLLVCCIKCRDSARNTAARLASQLALRERVCPTCGNGFVPNQINTRYCSPACRQINYRRRNRVTSPAAPFDPDHPRRDPSGKRTPPIDPIAAHASPRINPPRSRRC